MANNFFRVNRGITLTPSTVPSSATPGDIYFDSTQNAPMVYANSAWTPIGSSSTINYIPTAVASGSTPLGFSSYTDSAGTSPVDGTGVTTADITINTVANSSLNGTNLLQIAKTVSASTQGKGASIAFSIDNAKKGKVLSVDFEYLIASGTFVAGNPADKTAAGDSDLTIWIYDVTNSVLIQPSNYRLYSNSTTLASKFSGTFQAASNSTSYRLIFHSGTTNAATFAMYMDQLSISPVISNSGAAMTDWVSYPPTLTGFGSPTIIESWYRRNGSDIEIRAKFTAGTVIAVEARYSLPSGLTTDSVKVAGQQIVGFGGRSATGPEMITVIAESNVSYLTFGVSTGSLAASNKANASSMVATGNGVYFNAKVPIQGWSSNVQLSSDAGNSSIYSKATGNYTGGAGADATIILPTASVNDGGCYNPSTGEFTASSAGNYDISGLLITTTNNINIRAFINGVLDSVVGYTTNNVAILSGSVKLLAGQILTIKSQTSIGASIGAGSFIVRKSTNPQAIAASDTVAASYRCSANFTGSTTVPINFNLKEFDKTGSVTPSGTAWKFQPGISGLYSVNVNCINTIQANVKISVYKNGVEYRVIAWQPSVAGCSALFGGTTLELLATDYIDFRPSSSTTVIGTASINNSSSVQIVRVGNL